MNRVISEEDSDLHEGGNRLNLTRKSTIEMDEVSGTLAMLRRRKQPKITLFSTPNSKMNWTKNDELIILRGILDYQNVAEMSYKADSDTFLLFIKKFINVMFSKEQLMRKIRKLKTRFENNIEKFNNEKDLKFGTSDEYEVFKLSNLLWGQNKDQFDAPLHINKPNDGVSVVEHTPVVYTVMEKDKEKENGGKENGASVMERAPVTRIVKEKEKENENGGKENEALVEHTLGNCCTDKDKEKEKHKEKKKKEKENGALVEHTFVSCTDMEKEKQQKKETRKKRKKKKEKKEKMKEKENGALVEHGLVNNTIDMEKEKEMAMGVEMEKENGAALESYTELEKEKQQKQQQQEKKKKEKEKQQEKKEKENGALVEHGLVSYTIDMEKEKDMDMDMEMEKQNGAALESYTELEKEKQQKQQQQKKKKKEKQQEQQQQEKKEKEKQQEQKQENEKNGEKEDSEEEWCDLEDALEATSFKNLSKYHQKLMLQSLRNNIGDDKRKELRNEWKTLLVEEVKLNIKKEAFSAKLVNALISN